MVEQHFPPSLDFAKQVEFVQFQNSLNLVTRYWGVRTLDCDLS
jgi:hypothetical protein